MNPRLTRELFSTAVRRARGRQGGSIEAHIREAALRPQRYGPPRRIRSDVTVSVSRREGWPLYLFAPTGTTPSTAAVLVHGGAWVHEITKPHWRLAENLAGDAHMRVVVPIYPLVPFGTAGRVVPAVAELASELSELHNPCLIGDSAGGQIALSAAMLLRDTAPRTVLISPALDIALRNPAIADVDDPWIERDSLREYGRWWQGDLSDDDPLVSPLCGDLTGLGPMTVFSGTRDILNPDARALAAEARRCGVAVDYHEGVGLKHDYPVFPSKAGRHARRIIVETLRQAAKSDAVQ